MMRNNLVLAILALSVVTICNAQENDKLSEAKSWYLQPPSAAYDASVKIPFKDIIVKDFRYDTTKFGYVRDKGINKIQFNKNSSAGLSELLNSHYRQNLKGPDKNLVIIIKKLWLQKDPNSLATAKNEKKNFDWNDVSNAGACITELEIFTLAGDKYYPLVKLKDNFFSAPYISAHVAEFLLLPFDALIKKVAETDVAGSITGRKGYTWDELLKGYSVRFNIPVLSAPPPAKGVFLTFNDFKENKTVHPDFTVKKKKIGDHLFITEGGNEKELTEFWGYYDGENYYIRTGNNFFALYRQNNTWDFYGNNHLDVQYNTYGTSRINMGTYPSYRLDKQPLQLNMDTGDIY